MKRLFVLPILLIPLPTAEQAPLRQEHSCQACIFQRNGHLPYILRRYLDEESGPDENLSFGHCFVCIRCPDDNREHCYGWWPADPDGGDYDGDAGALFADHDEAWDTVSCQGITFANAERGKQFIYDYSTNFDYQVINQGARSCLGYCEDVAKELRWDYNLPLNDYTIPGDMQFPRATWTDENRNQQNASTYLREQRERFFSAHFYENAD